MGGITHVIGFDDAPFAPEHRGDVALIGAMFCGLRFEGMLQGRVRRDGVNATTVIGELIRRSRFARHLQLVMLQGIAVAGFNVIDLQGLSDALGLPVIAVCRKRPDQAAIRRALLEQVRGGRRKWRLIEQAGPVEPAGAVFMQRAGIGREQAVDAIRRLAVNSQVPEPLRTAHLIAAGLYGERVRQRV